MGGNVWGPPWKLAKYLQRDIVNWDSLVELMSLETG